MRDSRAITGEALLLLVLGTMFSLVLRSASAQGSTAKEKNYPVLGACERSKTLFPYPEEAEKGAAARPYKPEDTFAKWRRDYQTQVETVLRAHLKEQPIQCTESARMPASAALKELAAELPPWKDEDDRSTLLEADFAAVLLEHLRIYECSLLEHLFFIESRHELPDGASVSEFAQSVTDRQREVTEEIALAEATLERLLTFTGGADRLRPLEESLTCLQQLSLDLRNVLSLTADTTACLPRVWDVRESLRDPHDPDRKKK